MYRPSVRSFTFPLNDFSKTTTDFNKIWYEVSLENGDSKIKELASIGAQIRDKKVKNLVNFRRSSHELAVQIL